MQNLIPKPVSATPLEGAFRLGEATSILVNPENAEVTRIGNYLGARLRPATGLPLPVGGGSASGGNILLQLTNDTSLGREGYELTTTPDSIVLQANEPAGLFFGVQTLRQLLPPEIESQSKQSGSWEVATGTIRDVPRFEWRGTMLDVARHFFTVEDVKRYIELMAYLKLNRLHLHLSDDQGWRIEIKSWDKLAVYGGSTAVGGGKGGFYTQDDYKDIVDYAGQHYITVVPEIDMPGHTNAALASYAELNCDDTAPPLFTGIDVGFSSLCVEKDITYRFIGDVLRELAALTPGPYLHIGGDETQATADKDYVHFMGRVQEIVQANGKQMIGWEEIAQARLHPTTLAQHWHSSHAAQAADQGSRVIMSPATRAYLDMKYDDSSPLGLNWAGNIDLEKAYSWDPAEQVAEVGETDILGVEAPLWSETLETLADIEYMAFPRLFGIAEIGWSAREGRDWQEYRTRLAAQGPRLKQMGVNYYPAPQVDWE